MTRIDQLMRQGFTKCVDSGYASGKDDYKRIVEECNNRGQKVLRVKTDTKGLINYMIFAKE